MPFSGDVPKRDDVASFDITALISDQLERDDTALDFVPSNGFLLKAVDESVTNALSFYSRHESLASRRPQLSIEWEPLLGRRGLWQFVDFRLSDTAQLGVNVASGNLVLDQRDLSMNGTGLSTTVGRSYNSRSQQPGAYGTGRTMSNEPTLVEDGDNGNVIVFSDSILTYLDDPNAGGYVTPAASNATIVKNGTSGWTLTDDKTGLALDFDTAGRLTSRTDDNDTTTTNTYTSGDLAKIVDTASGCLRHRW